jgi:hypothetical protein
VALCIHSQLSRPDPVNQADGHGAAADCRIRRGTRLYKTVILTSIEVPAGEVSGRSADRPRAVPIGMNRRADARTRRSLDPHCSVGGSAIA